MTHVANLQDAHGRQVVLEQGERGFTYRLASGQAETTRVTRNDARALEVLGMTDAPPAQPSEEQLIAHFDGVIQAHLDETAHKRGYGPNAGYLPMQPTVSICTYINDPNARFAAEAQAFLNFRSAVWTQALVVLEQVRAGQRQIPSDVELIAAMPAVEWPSA